MVRRLLLVVEDLWIVLWQPIFPSVDPLRIFLLDCVGVQYRWLSSGRMSTRRCGHGADIRDVLMSI